MKKDIWIIVIVLCVLGIASVFYKVWKDSKEGKEGALEKFFNNDVIENYNNPVLQNNLYVNGSFNEGKAPLQFTGSGGRADIIVFPNNGQSSYVLRQSSLRTLNALDPVYYRVEFMLKPNSIYYLGCLYFSTRNIPMRNMIVYNNSSKVLLKTVEEKSYQYSKAGDFKYVYSLFKTPSDTDQVRTSIYLSYNYNNMAGYNYMTDLGLFELMNTNIIPVWDNLRSYFNPFNAECIEAGHADCRDLSFHGFDFNSKLAANVQNGNILLTGNSLKGPSAFKLQNSGIINLTPNFTMFIYARGVTAPVKKTTEKFANQSDEIKPADMTLEQFQKMWNDAGCTSILSENSLSFWRTQDYTKVLSDMKNYYSLASTCTGSDNQNAICLPGKCAKTGKVSSGNSESEAAMNAQLLKQPSSIKITNSINELNGVIATLDGVQLVTFPGNQGIAVSVIVPKTYGPIRVIIGGTVYETTMSTPVFMDLLFSLVYNGNNIILYLNGEPILETVCPKIYYDNNSVMITPNSDFVGNLYAFAYYNYALLPEQVKKVSDYFVKMKSIGEEVTTISAAMINYVNSFLIDDIGSEEPGVVGPGGTRLTPEEAKKRKALMAEEEAEMERRRLEEGKCPKVVFEDSHYYCIVQPNSILAKELGYSGLRDYGTNIDTARQIFETNFPKCPLPDTLDKNKYKGELEKCPFILINPDNPCKKFECKGTDWKDGVPKDANCRKAVDTYCSKYADLDNACYCWREGNKNKPECLKWRGQFDNPDKCDFRKYSIDNHPDSDKYIRKDKIPCWGCNLTAPESSGNYSCRKGSGSR